VSDTPRMDLALRKAQEDCTESYLLTEGLKLERQLNAANERIKRLEEELERTKQDRNAIAKKTREPLLLKLDHAAERIKRLEEVGDALANTQTYDLLETVNWRKAKEAKP